MKIIILLLSLIIPLEAQINQKAVLDIQQTQKVHQYIVVQAYQLLKTQLGTDVPIMKDHIGTTEEGNGAFDPGNLITIGAFREDEEDIVYGYGWPNTSSTHFWDPDRGDGSHFCTSPDNSCFENGYQKALIYLYSGPVKWPFTNPQTFNFCDHNEFITGVKIQYRSLSDFYNTGYVEVVSYYDETGHLVTLSPPCPLYIPDSNERGRLIWEILGRSCHLLGDVGTPAHSHNDQHDPVFGGGNGGIFGGKDDYEEWMYDHYTGWDYTDALSQDSQFGIIDVMGTSNPIKYLFYTTAQIANFFPSDDVDGNNIWDINDNFNQYPPLQTIINSLGTPHSFPPPSEAFLGEIASTAFVYSIRSTAALLYWFAIESGLLESSRFENSFGSGIVKVNGKDEPSGYKISVVNNPTVQLEAVDQGNNRFYKWEKYVNGVLNSTSYQRNFTASLGANVTYKAVFLTPANNEVLPQIISANTVLYGNYICNGTTISNNASLTIYPGTTIKLNVNRSMSVSSGSRIIANGTAAEPIVFERNDNDCIQTPKARKAASPLELADCSWGFIALHGDGNQFTNCIFDGGTTNISIESNNNSFSYCTSKNAIRGISTYYLSDGSWSSFSLDHCLIENNTYGITANYSYGKITNSEIKNNEEYGIYLYNARLGQNTGTGGLFTKNYVHNNGSYGVRIDYNGQLWLGYGNVKGNNKIANNGSHEIYISSSSSSSRLYQSSYFEAGGYGGYSDIYDVNLGYYVYNLAQTYNGENYISLTQYGENNYWNTTTTPSSYRFYGSIDRYPYKSSSQYVAPPSPSIVSNEPSELKQLVTSGMVTSIENNTNDTNPSIKKEKVLGLIDIKQKLLDLKSYIRNNPDSLINARFLKELYATLITEDPENSLGEKLSIISLIKEKRIGLESSFNLKSLKKSTQLIGETAMILEADELINNKEYKDALEKINNNVKYIKNDDNKRETLLQKVNIYEESGDYENALSTVLELKKIVKNHEKGLVYTMPDYDIIESNLKKRIGSSEKIILIKASNSFPSNEINKPLSYALYQNYPNPFNPSTTISFALPEPSAVSVDIYDITGELVTHLISQNYNSGIHNVIFDAGNSANGTGFSSGVYFVRVKMNSITNSNEVYSFTKKIVLLK